MFDAEKGCHYENPEPKKIFIKKNRCISIRLCNHIPIRW